MFEGLLARLEADQSWIIFLELGLRANVFTLYGDAAVNFTFVFELFVLLVDLREGLIDLRFVLSAFK